MIMECVILLSAKYLSFEDLIELSNSLQIWKLLSSDVLLVNTILMYCSMDVNFGDYT